MLDREDFAGEVHLAQRGMVVLVQLPELRELVRSRHRLLGELAHLSMPDLKESEGGLRDATVLKSLAGPLREYLRVRDEALMVSGFTDNRLVGGRNQQFADNWELSAQRALTVTRALIAVGVPAASVFAAAFGAEQPVGSNANASGRASNRRVEMAPMPRLKQTAAAPDAK